MFALPTNLRASPTWICAFGAVDDFRFEELRSKIDPQSRANSAETDTDTVAAAVDGAIMLDIGSVV